MAHHHTPTPPNNTHQIAQAAPREPRPPPGTLPRPQKTPLPPTEPNTPTNRGIHSVTPPATKTNQTAKPPKALTDLAKAAGIMTAYRSAIDHKPRHASTQTLLATLNILGIDIDQPDHAGRHLKHLLHAKRQQRLEPVTVVTPNRKTTAPLRVPSTRNGTPKLQGTAEIQLTLESGETHNATAKLADCPTTSTKAPDANHEHAAKLPLPKLPPGYHHLRVTHNRQTHQTTLIAAPTVSQQAPPNQHGEPLKSLGVFCPTYAIPSEQNLGIGNLADLNRLAQWAGRNGAELISTLPLLAVFNDDSPLHEPAPYSPVSRRFWNELFLDPTSTEPFEQGTDAKKLIASAAARKAVATLHQRSDTTDYRTAAKLNRKILDALTTDFYKLKLDNSDAFKEYLKNQPLAGKYARFRAVCETTRKPWPQWPTHMRNGNLKPADADPNAERRHLVAQFLIAQQMADFSDDMAARNARLYLDLAVGVHPDGFDVFNDQSSYTKGATVGAPPDPMFTEGQDWGFPALQPTAARNAGYTEIIDAVRTHTDHAHFLRLDHVMGFHRLFLIPNGLPARDGAYIRYREDELFAILSLESHRAGTRLIGENLGTVPDVVEKRMTKHKIGKLYVGQFEGKPNPKDAMNPVPRDVAASLNTHDLPTFVQHHTARDVPERIDAGVFNPELADNEIANRKKTAKAIEQWLKAQGAVTANKPKPSAVAEALYQYLAESDAELALINIEDLWGETHWQNIPGTTTEHPNWQHKLAKTLEEIERSGKLSKILKDLAKRRRGETQTFSKPTRPRKR